MKAARIRKPYHNPAHYEALIPEPKRPEPCEAIQLLNDWKLAFSQGKLAEAGVLLERLRLLSLRAPRTRWDFEPPVNGNTKLD